MPLETVHFDSVSGLVRTSQNRRLATLFNFTVAGHTEYSVVVPGRPRIEAGMTITAYLKEAGNWQTLVGWRDHANGEIVCDSATEEIIISAVLPLMMATFAVSGWPQPQAMVGVVIMAAYLAWAIGRIRTLRRARAALAVLPLPGSERAP